MADDSVFDLFIHEDCKIFHYHNLKKFYFDGIINGFYVLTIYHEDCEPEEIHFYVPSGKEFLFEVLKNG